MATESRSITAVLHSITGTGLLVLGDFMVDRTIYGEASRISPEAPTPVIRVQETRQQLGGAGNVVRNVDSLGGRVWCCAVLGEDEAGEVLEQELLSVRSCQALRVIRVPGRKTTLKTRVVAVQGGASTARPLSHGHQQVLRLDDETSCPISQEYASQVLEFASDAIGEVQGLVISDYAKGTLEPFLLQQLIALARSAGKPVIVDPKDKNFNRYYGASVLTPNAIEAEAALGISFSSAEAMGDSEWEARALAHLKKLSLEALLITRGGQGVTLIDREGFHHFPTSAREVFDVTGAGDTLLAAFSLAVASSASLPEAAQLGNVAAGVAVGKSGAAVVFPSEVERELGVRQSSTEAKVRTGDEIAAVSERLRRENQKIVFTNGCFDLLHAGHIYLLQEAKKLGDILVVGLNSDLSVKSIKGGSRPLTPMEDRAYALAALECVDYVVIFEEPDPLALVQRIRPDVLVKGDDYAESDVVGAAFLKSYGGVIRLIPVRPGVSTTGLVEKIRSGLESKGSRPPSQ